MSQTQNLKSKLEDVLRNEYINEDNDFITGILALTPNDELTQNVLDVIEEWHPESDQLTMFALDHYQKAFPDKY